MMYYDQPRWKEKLKGAVALLVVALVGVGGWKAYATYQWTKVNLQRAEVVFAVLSNPVPVAEGRVLLVKDKDGKEVSADKSLIEVVDGMVGQINDQAEKLFKALAYTGKTVREDGNVEDKADAEVNRQVNVYREKHPEVKDYAQAMTAVLQADPGLAQRYRDQLGDGQ